MDLNEHLEIDGLPLFVDEVDGEAVATPCTEAALSDKGAEALIARGLMPLIAYRDSDRVRVGGFRSILGPAAPLAFRG
jgi:type VI secretion system protein ImpC